MLRPLSLAQVQFQLGDEIGAEGKNSQVFRAHDPQLKAEIVVKKIKKSRIADIDEYFTESSLLYASAHTNVVPILYACQDDEHIYLAVPYFQKGSLKKLMNGDALTVREIIVFSTQFLSGLHHIHSKRLIHFDVKPDNILISDRGEAVLSDFGLAKQTELSGFAGQDRIYGSMTPPEAVATDQFTTRFDIYQVGLTLYRMCVGNAAFYAQFNAFITEGKLRRDEFRHAIVNGQFPDRSSYPEHIPAALRTTIRTCLAVDPKDRFGSALDVGNSLASIEGAILDWRFRETEEAKEWTKVCDGRTYRVVALPDGSVTATRNNRRVNAYCTEESSAKDVRRFLGDFE